MGKVVLYLLVVVVLLVVVARVSGDDGDVLFSPSKLEKFVDELPVMPTLQGFQVKDGHLHPGNLTVGMYQKMWKFHRDLPPTKVFAYGVSESSATVPGPTIEALQGIPTHVTWLNHLPPRHFLPWDPTIPVAKAPHGSGPLRSPGGVPTVVHLHGGAHPPASDGNSRAWFTSNFSSRGPEFSQKTYSYPNSQLPGNLWYHDHALGLTRVNLLAGLAGAYSIRSPTLEAPLGLPAGPEFDRHLVLFDRAFRRDGSLFINSTGDVPTAHPQWQPEYFGPVIAVNGKAWPFLAVKARRYRFRIINASNARFFRLFFSNGLRFLHIGSDNNYLPRPVTSKKFLLAPSEIVDLVVDFAESDAAEAVLRNDAPYPYPGGDPTDDLHGFVMKFVIRRSGEPVRDESQIPRRLLQYPTPAAHRAEQARYIAMYEYESPGGDPVRLLLNGVPYDAPVTETPKEGSSEIWSVINLTDDNHPLHVHLANLVALEQREILNFEAFKACMMKMNDPIKCRVEEHARGRRYRVPQYEQGWKNVFKVRPGCVTRVLVRFAPLHGNSTSYPFDPTGEPGYVYHCHILDHEDNEMMRPLKLIR